MFSLLLERFKLVQISDAILVPGHDDPFLKLVSIEKEKGFRNFAVVREDQQGKFISIVCSRFSTETWKTMWKKAELLL